MSELRELPIFSADNLPDGTGVEWKQYKKIALTSALRIEGPFRVVTSETENEPFYCEDGYLAVDSRGYPYAIAFEEFQRIYELA